jgi:hypothetical protein
MILLALIPNLTITIIQVLSIYKHYLNSQFSFIYIFNIFYKYTYILLKIIYWKIDFYFTNRFEVENRFF